jgi:NAD(P)-dependent dehydrogenase (short-subunit alcohol dehydrogenase family)
MDFTGKHVVITGASTGIGRASAAKIAALGGRVSVIARRLPLLEDVARECGGNAAVLAADVGDKAQLLAALDSASDRNGPIDGLFLNAAAGGIFTGICDYPDDSFEETLTVNLRAPWWAVRHVLPGMVARRSGAILVTGSLGSERGMAGNAGYVIAKHAVRGLAMAVAAEAAPYGVRCNLLIPGFIDTPMLAAVPEEGKTAMAGRTPQGRIGRPEEVASVAAFLLSDEASHVTAQGWAADGGLLGTLTL